MNVSRLNYVFFLSSVFFSVHFSKISINPVILSGNESFCTFWAKLQLDDVLEILLEVVLKFTKLADKARFTEKNTMLAV